jgi:hypothetical protein
LRLPRLENTRKLDRSSETLTGRRLAYVYFEEEAAINGEVADEG